MYKILIVEDEELERTSMKIFLEENLQVNPLKCEYFVPSIVNAQLQEGTATIRVLDTPDAWHGVTYPEDLPAVKAALKRLTDEGMYPEGFWK